MITLKKLLLCNDCIVGGGVETVMDSLISHMYSQRYKNTVVILNGEKNNFYKIYPRKIKFIGIRSPLYNYKRFSPKWFLNRMNYWMIRGKLHIALKKKYDVAIAMKEGQPMKIISGVNARKKIAWVHTDYQYFRGTSYDFTPEQEYHYMKKFDSIICVSETAKKGVLNTVGNPGNICVCYNPLNVSKIEKLSNETCSLNKDIAKPLFVSVGRLTKTKNYEALINACQMLNLSYNYDLWIIGDGDQYEYIQYLITNKQLHNVKLLGKKDNPYPYIAQADYFINPSIWESYCLVIQEALILNIPVIAARCAAIEESFCDDYGIITEGTADGLFCAMKTVLDDPKMKYEFICRIKANYHKEDLYLNRVHQIERLWE